MSTGHSNRGGSSAGRWLKCPGSVAFGDKIPKPPSGDFAEEGTAAHFVGEACLRNDFTSVTAMPASELVARGFVPETHKKWLSEEMFGHVKVYYDAVMASLNKTRGNSIHVEKTFDLCHIGEDMYGTNDALIVEPFMTLEVFDLKYGKGTVVEVEDNEQLMYYAVGAIKAIPLDFAYVKMTIVQPRAFHSAGPVRSHTITVQELKAWEEKVLKPGVLATEKPDAPLVPGPWCSKNFCHCIGQCPGVLQLALEVAQTEDFARVHNAEELTFPDPPGMSGGSIAKVLLFSDLFVKWAKGVTVHAHQLLNAGLSVPGFKLIQKSAHRKWKNGEEKTRKFLELEFGEDRIYAPRKVKSVAQMEAACINKQEKEAIRSLWIKPDGGVAVVPDTDSRPEIQGSATLDFKPIL